MIDENGPHNPRSKLGLLVHEVRACTLCAAHLPLGPRPVLQVDEAARIMVIGQAPGTRVHATGIPWNDPSGDRLRQWLNIDRAAFYDTRQFAIMAMGFCYPGRGKDGDLPPRPECAPLWHPRLRALLPNVRLTLLIGQYAQAHYLDARSGTMTATVRRFRDFLPQGYFPLPHPSPRNTHWLQQRPWMASDVIPALREQVRLALSG
ncbi:MAG: uracil-DNA glycosylase family protein [Stenotrophobium sp.]